MNENRTVTTLADVLALLEEAGLTGTRRRDMVSAINRVCEMAGMTPASVPAEPSVLRDMLSRIRPAAHGVSAKSYSNQRSLLAAALQLAGVIDPSGRGSARRHPEWGPLLEAVADDQRLSNGLAAFANWCASQGISPGEVDDTVVQRFLTWLEAKTLHPKPRDLVRRVPNIWNEASTKFNFWPATKLTTPFLQGASQASEVVGPEPELPAGRGRLSCASCQPRSIRRAAGGTQAPTCRHHASSAARTSAPGCFHLGSEWRSRLTRLADLVTPERFKRVLRYYHNQANREPNAFVIGVAKTLIQVAQYHAGATSKEVGELKRLASNLPAVPFDLTAKNKTLLRQLESERLRAKLYFLPEQLMGEVAKDLERGRVRFVEAQVAIAIDILLALPLRPQNLSSLNWQHNFSEPNGPRGQLLLHIAARDTKTKREDIVSEVPDEVARRLRWYRRHVLPRLGADVNGHLFVTEKGSRKGQATISSSRSRMPSMRHIGIHMTPHQFRHFGATSYLEEHPEDFETARAILGHAWSKTTRIYAGSSSRRASRAYNQYLFQAARGPQAAAPKKKAARVKTHANA